MFTMPALERRQFPRVTVHLPAIYRSTNLTSDGFVLNLSQGGLGLTCEALDTEGTEAEVQITLPGHPESMRLRGQVVWARRSNGSEQAVMGIRFGALSRKQRVALANFLIARCCSTS